MFLGIFISHIVQFLLMIQSLRSRKQYQIRSLNAVHSVRRFNVAGQLGLVAHHIELIKYQN